MLPTPCHPMPPQPHDHFSIAAIYQSIHQPTSLVIPFYQGEQHIQDSNTKKTPSQCSFRIVNSSMTIDHSSLCHRKAVTLIHTWHMTYRRDSSVQPHSLDLVFEFVQIRLGLWIWSLYQNWVGPNLSDVNLRKIIKGLGLLKLRNNYIAGMFCEFDGGRKRRCNKFEFYERRNVSVNGPQM